MLFKKNESANLVSKSTNVVFKLKGWISLLFYCVKHIHGQFKTYLKLRNIRFKQIAKTIPTVGKSRDILFKTILFCILCIYLNLYDTISFDICRVFMHCAVWCLDAVLYY
jgi:hypothetical protein